MKWSEITILTTNEAVEPISNILHETGASGLVIEDPLDLKHFEGEGFGEIVELDPEDYPDEGVRIKAYLPMNSFLGETVEEIKQAINQLLLYDIDLGKNEVSLSEVHEEEWASAWKKYYKPVKISNRITITPTWEDYQPVSTDELIIELDPGMAFGTGTHPTTILSIQGLEAYVQPDDKIIDVGCGSGVLSIASIKLGAESVQAFDLDDIAVKSTNLNVKLNHLQNQVTAKQNNLLDGVDSQADVIVSNILAEIIVRFVEDAYKNLRPGGHFITSGIIQKKKQFVRDRLTEAGFEIISVSELEDWVSIVAKKPE
ncbi:ribosomal protein L11 methyltransferase [Oceanobacillus oncorhynchi subsp. incaldanensis]|uniref:Ribosomal protein L11 methyltransferase n=1 Tax=Oceanobacillus oncorhynchi TaxID=545501 RepID=A0A0A1MXB2_9BACI|nr:50S ribosomal protein L11 methyltransferase [Oceanobacillus oncorhynchi]GIO19752.1 ribosomal protein L11 methyltransferase [Oceanobacillus oncorhynchi subsp. incaldanensis]CEI84194.1 Ribosomal protein L11 methyltransferase [Oceanobacillus oncorhynchi]